MVVTAINRDDLKDDNGSQHKIHLYQDIFNKWICHFLCSKHSNIERGYLQSCSFNHVGVMSMGNCFTVIKATKLP